MGRITVAVLCILLILGGGLLNLNYVDGICGDMIGQIELSLHQLAETGDDNGQALMAAYDIWQDNHAYLCTFIAHDQVDQVTSAFQRAMAFISYKTYDEYLAELQQLLALIHMVRNFDRPSIRSIL